MSNADDEDEDEDEDDDDAADAGAGANADDYGTPVRVQQSQITVLVKFAIARMYCKLVAVRPKKLHQQIGIVDSPTLYKSLSTHSPWSRSTFSHELVHEPLRVSS